MDWFVTWTNALQEIILLLLFLDEEDGGWQRLLRVQLLRNHLTDYFLIPAVLDCHQWNNVSSVKLIIMQYEKWFKF
jgi:hypothetical protein